ncbi:MAG: CapA family protein [Fibromonadales bacterium]|nr:CapA family protein [Fibromonadales bacterium]
MPLRTIVFVFFLGISSVFAQEASLRLVFAGDLMGHDSQIKAAKQDAGGKGYDYKPVYKHLKDYFSGADLAVINLEHTLAGEPYTGYPQFSSPDESVFAIKDAGFDLVATVNNHSLDRGKRGLERTISVLDSMGLKHFGIYRDTAERDRNYPLFVEKNGIKLAFLSYTYGTNGLVESAPNVVNRIDTAVIAADIIKAKQGSPDFTIVFIHWGIEYEIAENKEQRKLAEFMALNGVDLIIGGHPHVVQPFDKIFVPGRDSVPVIYSLGNFISNMKKRYTDGGVAFEAVLQKNDGKTKITDYGYVPFYVYKPNGVFRMLPRCKKNEPPCNEYKMKPDERAAMELFFKDTEKILRKLPEKSIK